MTAGNTSNNRKGVQAAMAGNHIEAEYFFRQAVKESDSAIEGSMNLVRLLHIQGRHAETIAVFKELQTKAQGRPFIQANRLGGGGFFKRQL